MEVVMMTLVVTALASVVLTWGISTITASRASLGGAVQARMDRVQEGLIVQDVQMINSGAPLGVANARVWIRNTGSIQVVIDQVYFNNFQAPILAVCSPGQSPSGSGAGTCPTATNKLSLPIQAVGAIDVAVSGGVIVAVASGQASSTGTTSTLVDITKSWVTTQWASCTVTITSGTDSGQGAKTIGSNTPTVLTISAPLWSFSTDSTSQYTISSAGMCSGATYTVIAATTRGTTFQGSFTV